MSTTPGRTPARLRLGAAIVALALAGALAGCGSTRTDRAAGGFGSISVQYSSIQDEQYAGEFYAQDKGYYQLDGFSAVNGISGPDTAIPKLLSGKVQVAMSDAFEVGAAVAEQDAPLKIIATTYQKNPYAILSLANGANITTPADLKGRRIGVQDSNAAAFKALLTANGLDEKRDKISVVLVGTDPTPLLKKQIDGYLGTVTDELPTLELAGYPLASLTYADHGVPYVAETYTVTDDYLKHNRALLEALLTAEVKGWVQTFASSSAATMKMVAAHYAQAATDKDGPEAGFGTLAPRKAALGLSAEHALMSTPETRSAGLLTISDALQQQTVQSLAAAGWKLEADDLFDTSIIDEIYKAHPELKKY